MITNTRKLCSYSHPAVDCQHLTEVSVLFVCLSRTYHRCKDVSRVSTSISVLHLNNKTSAEIKTVNLTGFAYIP